MSKITRTLCLMVRPLLAFAVILLAIFGSVAHAQTTFCWDS